MRRALAGALLLVAATGCSDRVPIPLSTPTETLPHRQILGVDVTVHGRVVVTTQTASIETYDFFFAPTVLAGTPGKEVLLLFRNGSERLHNFSIPDLEIDQDVSPGDIRQARIAFPSSAALTLYCRYHRDRAMIGAIEHV